MSESAPSGLVDAAKGLVVRALLGVVDAEADPGARPRGVLTPEAAVVVLDVLRATTTMTAALAAGAIRIVPVSNLDEARSMKSTDPTCVLAGERGGLPPTGFDLGNSPRDMTPESVGGRTVVVTTTNGTRAIAAASHCRRTLAGALINATAVADALRDDPGPVVFLCAGADGERGVEDELAAGAILTALANRLTLDGDETTAMLIRQWHNLGADGCGATLRNAPAGQALSRVGLEHDIDDCARVDAVTVVWEAASPAPALGPDGRTRRTAF